MKLWMRFYWYACICFWSLLVGIDLYYGITRKEVASIALAGFFIGAIVCTIIELTMSKSASIWIR